VSISQRCKQWSTIFLSFFEQFSANHGKKFNHQATKAPRGSWEIAVGKWQMGDGDWMQGAGFE
jgi:hypothetical protein